MLEIVNSYLRMRIYEYHTAFLYDSVDFYLGFLDIHDEVFGMDW
jgi:hypothetical protein